MLQRMLQGFGIPSFARDTLPYSELRRLEKRAIFAVWLKDGQTSPKWTPGLKESGEVASELARRSRLVIHQTAQC